MKRIFIVLIMVLMFSNVAFAGWEYNDIGTKYLNDDGTYKTGWHQDVDEKWYYLDDATGYMLTDALTPDGFYVSPSGEWVKEMEQNATLKDYENKVDVIMSALSESEKAEIIGYDIPVTVFYRNQYANPDKGTITIKSIEVSKNGVPYVNISVNDTDYGWLVYLDEIVKYNLVDGTVVEKKSSLVASIASQENFEINTELIDGTEANRVLKKQQVASIEVYIVESTK